MGQLETQDTFTEAISSIPTPAPSLRTEAGNRFWNKDDPVFQDSMVVRGGMWPHQRAWWDSTSFIKLLVGGYGSGKTNIGSKRIISLALQNAPCPVAAVSPSFRVARHTTVSTITDFLAGKASIYGQDFWWKYNRSLHEFRIRYKGREGLIIVYSGDEPDSLRGPNLAAAWIDEPFIQSVDVFNQMVARVRHPEAAHREICLTGTPEQLNWGYDLAVGELRDRFDVATIFASTRANKALPEDYVTHLLGAYDGKAAEAYVEGKFVNLSEGQVFYAFDPNVNVTAKYDDIPEGSTLVAGMDFNVNPMAMAVLALNRDGERAHVLAEYELPNSDTEYACQVLREHWVEPGPLSKRPAHIRPLTSVYPDATGSARKTSAPGGKSDFWYIRAAGFQVVAPHESPKRKDSFNAVNGRFKPALGEPKLTISPKCRHLIKSLGLYSHALLNEEDQKRMSHLIDAFRYPVTYLWPVNRATVQLQQLQGV